MNNQQTPLEKLISDKERIRKQCAIQEEKLNDDFNYIQNNAGKLLLSAFTAILFPNNKSENADKTSIQAVPAEPIQPIGLSDYISIAKGMMPVLWDVAKPLLITWGIKKVQHIFVNALFKKKK